MTINEIELQAKLKILQDEKAKWIEDHNRQATVIGNLKTRLKTATELLRTAKYYEPIMLSAESFDDALERAVQWKRKKDALLNE